jgi:hypothetical protein
MMIVLEDDPTVIVIEGCTESYLMLYHQMVMVKMIFFIQGIECYPNNTVEIYNRWGIKVFGVDGYDNKNNVFRGLKEEQRYLNRKDWQYILLYDHM